MNIKTFKKLIKEAVIEAIHEELPDIINETLSNNKQLIKEDKTFSFTSENVPLSKDVRGALAAKMGLNMGFSNPSTNNLKLVNEVTETGETVNPYLNFIMDAAKNMTAQDRAGLNNLE